MRLHEFTNEEEEDANDSIGRDFKSLLNIGTRFIELGDSEKQKFVPSVDELTDKQKYRARVKKNRSAIKNAISDKIPGAKYVLPFLGTAKDIKDGKSVGVKWSTGF